MGRLPLNWTCFALSIELLAVSGTPLLPRARQALLLQSADEPAALAAIQLPTFLTPDRIGAEFDWVVAAGGADFARSLLAVADEHGVAVAADRRATVTALNDGSAYR